MHKALAVLSDTANHLFDVAFLNCALWRSNGFCPCTTTHRWLARCVPLIRLPNIIIWPTFILQISSQISFGSRWRLCPNPTSFVFVFKSDDEDGDDDHHHCLVNWPNPKSNRKEGRHVRWKFTFLCLFVCASAAAVGRGRLELFSPWIEFYWIICGQGFVCKTVVYTWHTPNVFDYVHFGWMTFLESALQGRFVFFIVYFVTSNVVQMLFFSLLFCVMILQKVLLIATSPECNLAFSSLSRPPNGWVNHQTHIHTHLTFVKCTTTHSATKVINHRSK